MTNEKSLDDFVDDGVRQRILSFLPFKDRVRVESVSRAWRSASLDYNCKHTTSLSVIGYQVNRNFNQNFCTTASHRIHKLTDIIVRTDGMTDLSSVLKKVPRLKSLHLKVGEYEPILMNGEAAEIARLLPDLQHFSLSDDKIGANVYDDVIEIVEDMKNLVHLEMKFPLREGTVKTEMLQENLIIKDALTLHCDRLDIFSTNVPLSQSNCRLISNTCNRLRKLSVIGSSVPVTGLTALMRNGIFRGKYLRSLNMTVDTEEQLQTISNDMLCLHHFYCAIDRPAVRDVGCIGHLKNLRSLFLSCYTKDVLDTGLTRVFIGCKELTSLIISGEISDQSFEVLSDFVQMLRRIELNNGNGSLIGNRTMYAFMKLNYLTSLSIYSCDCSDGAFTAFLENAKRLTYLRIRRSKTLTKAVLPACIEYAEKVKKKSGTVEIMLPARLRVHWTNYLEFFVPSNLTMRFESY